MNLKENINKSILLLKDFNIISVYLFGSAAKNQLKPESDIDIAFLSFLDVDEYECFMKAQELAEIFKRDVDLIDLKKASTVFKAQIIGTSSLIYCNDDVKRAYFEMRALKEYALLNEERAEIIKNIQKGDKIYG
ncbi:MULTISPECIES: type VII toxin-antitoxin system MntA family adenylyltransferase antitoxin [Clostridium]|uniref:DNA polymerase, beta domain protein region n=3 Tax=Clostridium butyricum TaxID=1492 RepID=C4IFR7_CLOBU|nr:MULTISPECIES: nucleotidyltransferase domain-containing protein [Clostridium]ALP90655.1 DNA polymerase subunit beta [Clostridium butyricum]ALS17161.1 DNA polymerase subunit beta [Clostridium butyricum]ANF14278.1 DNA polymerase subunit beta [Clostridium butyricum]AOR94343.1 DNA polymerase subunit beta [Clostridium butyricum]AXB85132.1 nucleotidyltransferase domain-containing protein [Clostridium butyricum]